jgi:Amt family ammonium transporter
LILFIMNLIPGLSLRATEEAEILGIDDAEIGEFAYDYVELTREVLNDMSDAESKYSANHVHAPTELNVNEKETGPRPDIEAV